MASLCATCRRLCIDPWAYLRDALIAAGTGISGRRLGAEFSPWAWAKKQAEKTNDERVASAAGRVAVTGATPRIRCVVVDPGARGGRGKVGPCGGHPVGVLIPSRGCSPATR